jgi:signal transduction histidine kinase
VIFATADGKPRALLVSFSRPKADRDTLLVARAPGMIRAELQDASRWMASEQERLQEISAARDALTAKHSALQAAQVALQEAHAKLQGEVAARERLENELRLAHKLEAVGQLAAGLAHEINTPLQFIGDNVTFLNSAIEQLSTFATEVCAIPEQVPIARELPALLEAAAKRADLEFTLQESPKALASLLSGVDQVSKIVRAMKSFASADQTDEVYVELNQALLDTLVVAQSEYRNVASVETDLAVLPAVKCVPGAINQAFLHLIVNAAHAIAEKKSERLGKLRVATRRVGDFVEVSISDDGCGIPEAIRHRVFDPFFTTTQVGRGSGQGLATTRRIVKSHGGSIAFESVSGEGTTFMIRLPLEVPTASRSEADAIVDSSF